MRLISSDDLMITLELPLELPKAIHSNGFRGSLMIEENYSEGFLGHFVGNTEEMQTEIRRAKRAGGNFG